MRYPIEREVGPLAGTVVFDMTGATGEEGIDGVKVDREGRLYVSGPGGLWVLSPSGEHLGTLRLTDHPANMAWGDADGRMLYLTAETGLYRVRMCVAGLPFAATSAPGI